MEVPKPSSTKYKPNTKMKKMLNPALWLLWATTSLLWQDIRGAAALAGQVDRAAQKRVFVFVSGAFHIRARAVLVIHQVPSVHVSSAPLRMEKQGRCGGKYLHKLGILRDAQGCTVFQDG